MNSRSSICKALTAKMKTDLDGTAPYVNNLYTNVFDKVKHFQDINDFPTVTVTPGPERREDMPSHFTLCYLEVNIRIYVKDTDDAQGTLESIIGDIENFVDTHQQIEYNLVTSSGTEVKQTISNTISSITTDEGLLDPEAIGEIILVVQYEKLRL